MGLPQSSLNKQKTQVDIKITSGTQVEHKWTSTGTQVGTQGEHKWTSTKKHKWKKHKWTSTKTKTQVDIHKNQNTSGHPGKHKWTSENTSGHRKHKWTSTKKTQVKTQVDTHKNKKKTQVDTHKKMDQSGTQVDIHKNTRTQVQNTSGHPQKMDQSVTRLGRGPSKR